MRTALIFITGCIVLMSRFSSLAGEEGSKWTDKGVTITGFANDALGHAAEGKKFKASDLSSKEFGNRAARNALASEGNALKESAGKLQKAAKLGTICNVITVADAGSKIAGSLSEGDYAAAAAVTVNEGAKTMSAAAGAAVGAKTLAVAGSFFGPVGTVVGGAVGAAGGAIIASAGYDMTVGESLGNAVESGIDGNKTKADYVDDARAAREAHFAKKAQEQKDKQAELDRARAARAEYLAKQAEEQKAKQEQIDKAKEAQLAKLAEEQKIKDRKAAEAEQQARKRSKPKVESQPAAATSDKKPEPEAAKPQPKEEKTDEPPKDSSIPIIPVDCKISITVWNKDYPDIKIPVTYTILDGKVTGGYTKDWGNKAVMHSTFTGTIKDNVITGHDVWKYDPMHYSGENYEHTTYCSGSSDSVTTLNLDGSVSIHGTYTSSWRVEVHRGEWGNKDTPRSNTQSGSFDSLEMRGTWHIVSKAEKKAAGKGK